MKTVEVSFESTAPYSQSKMHETPKKEKESAPDYDARTWREKCNTNDSGIIVIPAMAFKQALDKVASRLGMKTTGKGTMTKHFAGGVLCMADVPIGVHKDEVPSIKIFANSDGKRGSGSRVPRIFPQVASWKGKATFAILDDTVTRSVFEKHIAEAGQFIGIGRFRPENGGLNGRFRPTSFKWSEL